MQPAGLAEVERAKADGRWDAAYDSPAAATVPPDLAKALAKSPKAKKVFDALSAQNRYSILYRLRKREEARDARATPREVRGDAEAGEERCIREGQTEPTTEKLQAMRLDTMATTWRDQTGKPDIHKLAFDERFGMLVDAEWLHRENKRLATALRDAKLRMATPASRTSTTRRSASSTRRRSASSQPAAGWPSTRTC